MPWAYIPNPSLQYPRELESNYNTFSFRMGNTSVYQDIMKYNETRE